MNSSSDLLTTLDCTDNLDHASNSTDLGNKATTTVTHGIFGKQWLSSDHMSEVNKLMLEAGFCGNRFQEKNTVPLLNKGGMWCIPDNGFESKKSPSVNIHYNSKKHRVTSF